MEYGRASKMVRPLFERNGRFADVQFAVFYC